jgi:hypothetical protein
MSERTDFLSQQLESIQAQKPLDDWIKERQDKKVPGDSPYAAATGLMTARYEWALRCFKSAMVDRDRLQAQVDELHQVLAQNAVDY